MKNDNDTDRVKKIINDFKNYSLHRMMLHTEDFVAIENVLSELKNKDKQIELEIKGRDILVNLNTELSKELETWKKIAEKLTEQVKREAVFYDTEGISSCDLSEEKYCKCSKHNNGATCKQCIIDWARSEVLNDKQS